MENTTIMSRKSIQILRGTETYDPAISTEILADGQLFYSKNTGELYIGDGEKQLSELSGTQIGLNLKSEANGAIKITDSKYLDDSIVFTDGTKGTQFGDKVPGGIASGIGAVALGGLRYDYYTSPETLMYNQSVDPTATEHWGRTPTSAEGKQSFAAGGSNHAYGDWSTIFGKDSNVYQKGTFGAGGHVEAGMTEAEFLAKYPTGVEPHENKTYDKSYSLAAAFNERCKSKGRASFSSGFKAYANENLSKAQGVCTTADRIGQSVDGVYNKKDIDATFIIGNGWELNGKDFTKGTEPTTPEKTSEIKRFNNFYITKRGEIVLDGEKLDTFGTGYIPTLKLIQHPKGYTGNIHHPVSIWWVNDDANTAKAELMAKDNANGTNGHVSLEYFKYRNIKGQSESAYLRLFNDRIETNKPIKISANGITQTVATQSWANNEFASRADVTALHQSIEHLNKIYLPEAFEDLTEAVDIHIDESLHQIYIDFSEYISEAKISVSRNGYGPSVDWTDITVTGTPTTYTSTADPNYNNATIDITVTLVDNGQRVLIENANPVAAYSITKVAAKRLSGEVSIKGAIEYLNTELSKLK